MSSVLIKEIGKVITGNTPSKNNSGFYSSNDIGFIKPDVISDEKITYIETTNEFISEQARSKARIVKDNAVLITCIGIIGKICIVKDGEYAFNQQINAIEPNERVSAEYLAYCLLYNKKRLSHIANAPVVPIINKTQFENFQINIIDKREEQNQIVEVLKRTSNVIDMCRKQISQFDTHIKSRFVEMFGDPNSNSFGWDRLSLDKCLESIDNGKSFVCDNNPRVGDAPAILKLSAATYGIYKAEENKAIINENDFVESAEIHDGDLLFTRKNTPELVGMSAYVFSTPGKLMMPDLIFRLNTKDNCNKVFLWQLINHDLFRSRIQGLAGGSAKSMSNISKERLRKLLIPLPPIKLQNQFAAFVHQVDKLKFEV